MAGIAIHGHSQGIAPRHPGRRSGYRAYLRAARERLAAFPLARTFTPQGTVVYADRGQGAPVLLIHGIFGGSDAALRQFRDYVPEGSRVIAPSRFGYLGSALPDGATPALQADAFASLLDVLHIPRVPILAVSAGVTSAVQFAIRHPERVSSLVLISSNAPSSGDARVPLPKVVARVLWGSNLLMWACRRFLRA